MKISIASTFNISLELFIFHLKKTKTLEFVSSPIIKFKLKNESKFPLEWHKGSFEVDMFFLGFIPLGSQIIKIELIKDGDGGEFCIRDNGGGDLIDTWDHYIFVSETEEGKVAYRDEIEIKAGLLTLFGWLFAYLLYNWRQYRWKLLIKRSFKHLEEREN